MRTGLTGAGLLILTGGLLSAPNAFPCSVSGIPSPQELVREAELIVRAQASGYATEPKKQDGSEWLLPGSIRFRVLEVVKGTTPTPDVTLPGYLSESDDFNDRPVPYDFVRPEGRHGDCFASKYRRGAEHLLFIRSVAGLNKASWAPLAPTNEQLRSDKDPWLMWVRNQAARLRVEHP